MADQKEAIVKADCDGGLGNVVSADQQIQMADDGSSTVHPNPESSLNDNFGILVSDDSPVKAMLPEEVLNLEEVDLSQESQQQEFPAMFVRKREALKRVFDQFEEQFPKLDEEPEPKSMKITESTSDTVSTTCAAEGQDSGSETNTDGVKSNESRGGRLAREKAAPTAAKIPPKTRMIKPSDILFSQSNIGGKFGDGHELTATMKELMNGVKSPEDLEAIKVVFWKRQWWTLTGNRRLYLYKELESLGIVKQIQVIEKDLSSPKVQDLFDERMTTETDGKSITIRNSSVKKDLQEIIDQWKRNHPGKQEAGTEKKTEPFQMIDTFLYQFDSKNQSKTLMGFLAENRKFGFVIVNDDCTVFGTVARNTPEIVHEVTVKLPPKYSGDSIWNDAVRKYVSRVANVTNELFMSDNRPNVRGLILAGTADFRTELSQADELDISLQVKVVKVVEVSCGGETGFSEAVDLAAEAMENILSIQEKKVLERFSEEMFDDYGKFCCGALDTLKALERGAVEILIVWDNLDMLRYVMKNDTTKEEKVLVLTPEEAKDKTNFIDAEGGEPLELVESQSLLEWIAIHYKEFGSAVEIITDNTLEGTEFVKGRGGIAGILRY